VTSQHLLPPPYPSQLQFADGLMDATDNITYTMHWDTVLSAVRIFTGHVQEGRWTIVTTNLCTAYTQGDQNLEDGGR
jgi:hypothetical protein